MPRSMVLEREDIARQARGSQPPAAARDRRATLPDAVRLRQVRTACGPSTNRAARRRLVRVALRGGDHATFCGTSGICAASLSLTSPTRAGSASVARNPGSASPSLELTAMQRRHRRRQAESQPGPGQGTACLKPHKSLHGVAAVGLGDPRPMVGDAEQHLVAVAPRFDHDLSCWRRRPHRRRAAARPERACRI